MEQAKGSLPWSNPEEGSLAALAGLVEKIREGCDSMEEWPAQVGAGVYAGVDYLVEEPVAARVLLGDDTSSFGSPFRQLVSRMTHLLVDLAPLEPRLGSEAPAAVIAGMGLMIGGCIRAGRPERLAALRGELHLLVLLPFLDFGEAKLWVDLVQEGERA